MFSITYDEILGLPRVAGVRTPLPESDAICRTNSSILSDCKASICDQLSGSGKTHKAEGKKAVGGRQ